MARKHVVEIKCDRCTRVENRTMGEGESTPLPASFKATMGSKEVSFDDLCTPCWTTVKQHLDAISKKIEGMSPDRKKTASVRTQESEVQQQLSTVEPVPKIGLKSTTNSGATKKGGDAPSPPAK